MLNKKALAATAAAAEPVFIEDCFSTTLYTGNGSTQTITNGIDLAGEGGLVWLKIRSQADNHALTDTTRSKNGSGYYNWLQSNSTAAVQTQTDRGLTSFNSNGFSMGGGQGEFNASERTYASWTFRKAEKFFDVVTYTGNGVQGRAVAHNLGSVPGCIIVKRTNTDSDWIVYHRSLGGNTKILNLNSTSGTITVDNTIFSSDPTSTVINLGSASSVNGSSQTYVAYLFAHDAGGFGDDGSQNVISCGSFTTSGAGGATVDLGYEAQWLLVKRSDSTGNWFLVDNMRGLTMTGITQTLYANLSDAEVDLNSTYFQPRSTGFFIDTGTTGQTYIYIAIRRGPMKTPESGTSVFNANAGASEIGNRLFDLATIFVNRTSPTTPAWLWTDRLRGWAVGGSPILSSETTAAEVTRTTNPYINLIPEGLTASSGPTLRLQNSPTANSVWYRFRRAPGFFDEVCYTGTGSANTVLNHNLGVAPELIITKQRSGTSNWSTVYGITLTTQSGIVLNSSAAGFGPFSYTPGNWILNAAPTASTITIGSAAAWNGSGSTFVAYLFASCPGVSKVGSYTGNGTSQTINCGFTAGARFVLLKSTSTTGNWVVFDSARGIVSGNDPYLLLNSTAAEVTDKDAIDTDSTGFVVNETTGPNVNTNGASYIFLAIS